MDTTLFRSLLSVAAIAVLASAAENVTATEGTELGTMEVVDTQNKFRNRTQSTAPELVYDREFFERFEPTTAGDMLKRVPGVVFKGDVNEYDFPSFRGLDSFYTQILINGKRVPGFEPDGGINLDRIPAEMIERIEIVRSPSAEIDSQGVAGTINIVLKDGADMPEGGNFRVGVSRHSNQKKNPWSDTKYKPNLFGSYHGKTENLDYTVSAYYQERYVAKDKKTNLYEDGFYDKESWVESEDEWDNRDSKDLSLYAKVDSDVTAYDRLSVRANYFKTNREEEQYEFKHERDAATDPFYLPTIQHQIMDIDQTSYTLDAEWNHTFDSMDELVASVTYDKFDGTLEDYEAEVEDEDNGVSEGSYNLIKNIKANDYSMEKTETDDTEIKAALAYHLAAMDAHKVKFGVQAKSKTRETTFDVYDVESGVIEPDPESLGNHEIDETRLDVFVEDVWSLSKASTLQLGLRVETTSVDQTGTEGDDDTSYVLVNPSVHYKMALNENDQFRVSLAQTVRRPNFDDMVPFLMEDDPDDGDGYTGNTELEPEKSLGLDLGYEHAFSEQYGIVGVNLFYRSVTDKIEINRVGDYSTDEGDGGLYTPDNVGDGIVYGLELDASFPLTLVGLPSVGFFANYTLLDSKIDDPYTGEERMFNDQANYVYNVGLTNTHKDLGLSYGFSYQKRGDSKSVGYAEEEVTKYDGNLEAYVEYLLDDELTLRFTGDNLLDQDVTEEIKAYDSIDDQKAGIVEEYETQIERGGPVFMVTLSGRF
jgi:outer membrane receptor for ferrienterochelin and colicins